VGVLLAQNLIAAIKEAILNLWAECFCTRPRVRCWKYAHYARIINARVEELCSCSCSSPAPARARAIITNLCAIINLILSAAEESNRVTERINCVPAMMIAP
jgi:hypothetical protein